jgi:glycosyltransferase involved in cell wall biosynthesis
MRLVFVTQRVNPDDPVLGATVAKLRALAARVDEVVVLADAAVPGTLPANCRVHLFRSRSKAGRGVRFETSLARELARRPRPAAVVAHMCPIYAVLAAPLARPLGVPVLLWYAHWNATPTLRLAARVSSRLVSVDRRSVPLDSRKVVGIGHGIDMAEFTCADGRAGAGLEALALGRYSAAKGLDVVVRAVRLALDSGVDLRLRLHGVASTAAEEHDRDELTRLVAELGLGERVEIGGPVPRHEVPALLHDADVLVNNMRAGAPDKVVYEACASCLPVLVSNPVFDELLDDLEPRLRFARERPEELAAGLAAFAGVSADDRRALGRTLRERVAAAHSVETWADRILELAR